MNVRFRRYVLVVLALLAGCVPSLNPIYTEDQLVFDPNVLGVWTQSNDRWEFARAEGRSYRLIHTAKDGQQGRFIACLAEIDGTMFLDLSAEEPDSGASGFYKFHLVPIHTIYRVKRIGESDMELAAIDYQWLDRYLADHSSSIQFAEFNGRKMLTAPTKDVQAFVLEHKAMFTGEFTLERQVASVN